MPSVKSTIHKHTHQPIKHSITPVSSTDDSISSTDTSDIDYSSTSTNEYSSNTSPSHQKHTEQSTDKQNWTFFTDDTDLAQSIPIQRDTVEPTQIIEDFLIHDTDADSGHKQSNKPRYNSVPHNNNSSDNTNNIQTTHYQSLLNRVDNNNVKIVKQNTVTTTTTITKPLPLLPQELIDRTTYVAHKIRQLYQLPDDEKGHSTLGHKVITTADKYIAVEHSSDLLYGEILPIGVSRAFDCNHLNVANARILYDLGSGLGKLAVQAFLQYPNLHYVVGIELSHARCELGFNAIKRMNSKLGNKHAVDQTEHNTIQCNIYNNTDFDNIDSDNDMNESKEAYNEPSYTSEIHQRAGSTGIRTLELRQGDMLSAHDAWLADVVICETKLPAERYIDWCRFLSKCKYGCRILTYEDLDAVWNNITSSPVTAKLLGSNPFTKLAINISTSDRFETSWSIVNGAHFHLYQKTS